MAEDIVQMRRDRGRNVTLKTLARRYHTSVSNVHLIVTRQTWRHVP